jgi:type IV pilus assembly protein PilB
MATAIDPAELKGRKLGRVLTKLGKVSREQVHEALEIQKTRKAKIGEILVELGYIKPPRTCPRHWPVRRAWSTSDCRAASTIPEAIREVIPSENVRSYERSSRSSTTRRASG